MAWFTGGGVGPDPNGVGLDAYGSSMGSSVAAAMGDAWNSNPINVGIDYLRLRSANAGEKLDQSTAAKMVSDAGVKLKIPDDGYSAEALQMLIERQQEQTRRNDILSRAPVGFVPTSTRFAAQLLTGLTDPLNIAAGFVPVVGQARYASMLARAGESALARAGVRARVGAIEGAVGVGAMEPGVYYARTQMQDDYHAVDSLQNILFGAVMGSALHSGAGAIGDVMRGGGNPAARFTGLSADEVQTVLNFDRERVGMKATDMQRALDTFTPEMRRAADPIAPMPTVELHPQSAGAIDRQISPEIREVAMRSAIADMVRGRSPDIETILRMDPAHPASQLERPTLEQVRAVTERQAQPEAVTLADRPVEPAPRIHDAEQATLAAAIARVEQAGTRAQITDPLASLRPWDEAISDAGRMRGAARAAALCGI